MTIAFVVTLVVILVVGVIVITAVCRERRWRAMNRRALRYDEIL